MLIRAAIFAPPVSYYAAPRRIPYFTGAIWNSRWALARSAVSKRGSLGDIVGRGACAKSTVVPVLGTLRRELASSMALGEPSLTERSIISGVVPGTFLREDACSFALGDSSGSPALALAAKLKIPVTATASKSVFFI